MIRIGVLGENDHADLGMRSAKDGRSADAFVAVRRRHADVRHHHVRALGLDRRQEGGKIDAGRNDLDLRLGREELLETLADEQTVVGKSHSDRHASDHSFGGREIVPVDQTGSRPRIADDASSARCDRCRLRRMLRWRSLPNVRCPRLAGSSRSRPCRRRRSVMIETRPSIAPTRSRMF